MDMNVEEIFDKPEPAPAKKKRTLTEAQKAGLAKGRAKAKAMRDAKKKEQLANEVKKEAEKVKEKKEAKQLSKDKAVEKQQKETKKQLLSQQEITRAKVKAKEADAKQKIETFNNLKYKCMESCETEEQFNYMDKLMNKYITKSDILKGNEHLQQKVGYMVLEAGKRFNK